MKKRNIIIIILIFFAISVCYFFGLLPIVFESENKVTIEEFSLNKGERFNPLDTFDLENENYELYYIQSFREKNGLFSVLYTNDRKKLNSIKNFFNCSYTGGDIATYESKLILMKNKEPVLNTYIGLENQPFPRSR